ncbi:MAG: four helix bundle protein [Bacteroidia bacterium]|nr:four helix bundle protein [Bacteroidia bacterium]
MKTENLIQDKSFDFAIKVVSAYKYLVFEQKEFVMSKQLLRSGTAIGANLEEAIGGQSKANFFAKISIFYKEARETIYWLKLLYAIEYFTNNDAKSLLLDAEEICRILGKIQITMKQSLAK